MIKIGVLALQGDLEEHIDITKKALEKLGLKGEVLPVKKPEEIEGLDGLIITGGESTVFGKVSSRLNVFSTIKQLSSKKVPLFGTCAGLIVFARNVYDRVLGETNQPTLDLLNVTVSRNYFGRQRESFEADLLIPVLGDEPFRGVFIRAPAIEEIGENVEILARLEDIVVAVRQENILATAFHPELTNDTRFHEYFLKMILQET
ncbi:MAG: pyridoxal 5'-phosphate synthase glutaminase subunit PdxT [Candidatus Hodarchaeota archaeon]